ncbi:hypothetical protein S245_066222, partial [Arachis hypogaea]
NVTQTSGRDNARRNHPRPEPSGQRIIPGKEDEAPRVEVPNPNREDGDSKPEMYQYEFEELCSPLQLMTKRNMYFLNIIPTRHVEK